VFLIVLMFCGQAIAAADSWSLDFESSNGQYVSDGVTGWDATNDRSVTVCAWVQFESLGGTMAICGTESYSQRLVFYYDYAATRLKYIRGTGTAVATAESNVWTPTVGVWYFVALRHDKVNAEFFVNDAAYGSVALSGGPRINSCPSFYVGADYAGWDTANYRWAEFDGKIAGLLIVTGDATTTNYVLSDTDLATAYNGGVIDTSIWSSFTHIKRLYRFEEGAGTSTSNGYLGGTATLTGDTGTPTWVQFTTPLYATSPSPADEATGQNRTVKLSWMNDASAASHDLWGGTDQGSLAQLQTASTQEWYVVTGLSPGVPYYWRVDEVDSESNTPTGTVWSFTPAGKIGAR
jgi:hypothetical protein